MSFIENIRARQATIAAAKAAQEAPAEPQKKVNPLSALKAKKSIEEMKKDGMSIIEKMRARKAAEAEAKKDEENVEPKSLQERAEAVVAAKLEKKEDVPAIKPQAEESKPEDVQAEPVAEDKADEVQPEQATEKKDESPKTEEVVAEEPKTEEKPVEKKPEDEKPKKGSSRRKATAKKEEEAGDTEKEAPEVKVHEYVSSYDILGKKVSYDDMAGIVMDYFIDDEWKAMQDKLNEKMNAIRIEPDMNPGTLKYALAELNNLNDEIAGALTEQKQLLDALTDKDTGAATAIMAMNSRGSNSEERKANGFAALTHAKFGGEEEVNLIALINAVKARYVFLSSLQRRIQYKSGTCITMSGAMKMEASFVGNMT